MKTINRTISFALVAVLSVCSLFSQTTVTSTTLSAALSYTSSTVRVAAATGITAPTQPSSAGGIGSPSANAVTMLYVDREAMRVTSVSGTTISVQRGWGGTLQASHLASAKVWVGPGSAFHDTAPEGSCTASAMTYTPWIVSPTGELWNCGNGQWTTFSTFAGRLTQGATLVSGDLVIAPTNPVHLVSGTSAVTSITVPAACPSTGCTVTLIPTGNFTWTTAGNIGLAGTAVTGRSIVFTYAPSTGKWYPSYV